MTHVVFLPGAGGTVTFWRPVADRLSELGPALLLGWPGFGDEPPDPAIRSVRDLVGWTVSRMPTGPNNVVAQSMGGVVALSIALDHPERVRRLVLCATSGGVDAASLGQEDWRPGYQAELPDVPNWFVVDRTDLTSRLPSLAVPTLVVHGDRDPICPPRLARFLAEHIPGATYACIPGGDHTVARDRPDELAPIILRHLKAQP